MKETEESSDLARKCAANIKKKKNLRLPGVESWKIPAHSDLHVAGDSSNLAIA
jgi:hypothetical protein